MNEVFVKKYWPEEDIMFLIHFKNDEAIRQIEITSKGKTLITLEEDSTLCDQPLSHLDINKDDYIDRQEFEEMWI